MKEKIKKAARDKKHIICKGLSSISELLSRNPTNQERV